MQNSYPSVRELATAIQTKTVSAEEVCQNYLDKIQGDGRQLNAFLETSDKALERARFLDQQKEKKGSLWGVPVAIKDNFCVQGMKTTAASNILKNFIAPYTAHCVARLESEGALVIGKTNMDEFGMGSSNENSIFGPCKNPWDTTRVSGGSSGGSAVAVAAQMAPLALGSDTGGSVRQPASFCGVVGVKPTYGSISRYGLIAFASSLDQTGVFAHNVDDAALALDIMIDKDPRDSTNVPRSQGPLSKVEKASATGLRIGVPRDFMERSLDPVLKKQIEELISKLKDQGSVIETIELPCSSHAIPVYYIVAACEASSNLSRYDGVRFGLRETADSKKDTLNLSELYRKTRSEGFGEEVKRRILLGTFALSADSYDSFYKRASQVRRLIADDFKEAFTKCDLILGPVTTGAAFSIGEKIQDPVSMYDNDIFTTPASLVGLPCMSIPLGLDAQSMPLGVQIMAPSFFDEQMISFAKLVEELCAFSGRQDAR